MKTLDLSKYRKAPDAAPTAAPTKAGKPAVERPQLPLVSWSDLGGIDGLVLTDVWTGVSKVTPEKPVAYAYVGANLKFPDGAEATALTGADTQAGQALTAALNAGTFDRFNADGSMVVVPVHVRNRMARPVPGRKSSGKPMSFLTFG